MLELDVYWLLAGISVTSVARPVWRKRYSFAAVYLVMWVYNVMKRRRRRRNLRGKVVVITGGAGGLGRELSLKLMALGAKVVVWDLNEKLMADIQHSVSDTARVDVTDREGVMEAGKRVLERFGPVHMLINNAGVQTNRSVLEIRKRDLDFNFGVNTFAHYWTVQAFLPAMIEKGSGSIVAVSSLTALTPTQRLAHYAGSKMAVNGFMRTLMMETTDHPDVTMTTICPFKIDTGMFDDSDTSVVPPLKAPYVADRIINAAVDGKALVVLPDMVNWYYYLRNFIPMWLHDKMVPLFFSMSHPAAKRRLASRHDPT